MSAEADLAEALECRTEAWARVNGDIAALRAGLAERPITKRLKDHAADRVIDAVDTVKAVAAENRFVIGGVILALAGWFLRGPIIRFVTSWFGREKGSQ
ncbi:MAG: hypothetical protein ACKVOL_02155 [Novosphingobium sp.]